MAIDRKYGRVTLERGTIGEDEPVFVLRGQDKLLLPALVIYGQLAEVAGSPQRHLDSVAAAADEVAAWQAANFTKVPSSDSLQ